MWENKRGGHEKERGGRGKVMDRTFDRAPQLRSTKEHLDHPSSLSPPLNRSPQHHSADVDMISRERLRGWNGYGRAACW